MPQAVVMNKLYLFICFLTGTLILSCDSCNITCNDCEFLYEAACECTIDYECQCSNGILDKGEESVDCGGVCQPCFGCTTDFCTYLSGAKSNEPRSQITWNDQENFWTMTFTSDGIFFEDIKSIQCIGSGYWTFNDSIPPTEIILTYTSLSCNASPVMRIPLVSLTEFELQLLNGDGKLFTFTPNN